MDNVIVIYIQVLEETVLIYEKLSEWEFTNIRVGHEIIEAKNREPWSQFRNLWWDRNALLDYINDKTSMVTKCGHIDENGVRVEYPAHTVEGA